MTRLARFLAAISLLLGVSGCGAPDSPSGPPLKLTIAESSQPLWVLFYVAQAKGFFTEAGLDVAFTSFELGKDALDNVLEGKADLATVLEMPVVAKIYAGNDIAIVSTLYTSSRNQVLLARRDRGIAVPADLEGKRIGLSLGTAQEYMLSVFLAIESIPAASITRVQVAPADYQKSLLDGSVDAVIVFNPYKALIQKALGEGVTTFYFDTYVENALLVGKREVVAGKREAMTRLVKALVKAQGYRERNKDETIRITFERFAGRFAESAIREAWDDFRPEAKLDNILLSTISLEGQWMKDSGRFSGPVPDFRKALFTDYLKAVKPEAVTVQPAGVSR